MSHFTVFQCSLELFLVKELGLYVALLLYWTTENVRPIGRPKLRYKDTCKSALKCSDV